MKWKAYAMCETSLNMVVKGTPVKVILKEEVILPLSPTGTALRHLMGVLPSTWEFILMFLTNADLKKQRLTK